MQYTDKEELIGDVPTVQLAIQAKKAAGSMALAYGSQKNAALQRMAALWEESSMENNINYKTMRVPIRLKVKK